MLVGKRSYPNIWLGKIKYRDAYVLVRGIPYGEHPWRDLDLTALAFQYYADREHWTPFCPEDIDVIANDGPFGPLGAPTDLKHFNHRIVRFHGTTDPHTRRTVSSKEDHGHWLYTGGYRHYIKYVTWNKTPEVWREALLNKAVEAGLTEFKEQPRWMLDVRRMAHMTTNERLAVLRDYHHGKAKANMHGLEELLRVWLSEGWEAYDIAETYRITEEEAARRWPGAATLLKRNAALREEAYAALREEAYAAFVARSTQLVYRSSNGLTLPRQEAAPDDHSVINNNNNEGQ